MAEQNLKDKTVKGAGWSFIDNFASQGIAFLVSLILARLLTPGEYGLIGIIAIFIAVFNCIVDSGFSQALIRKIDADNLDYNTCFYSNFVLSVILCVGLFFASPAISSFFNQPTLIELTRVMSIIIIINALAIIQRTVLIKKIDFKTQTRISIISSVISGVIGIGMALTKFGVWALVGQQLSRQIISTLLFWAWGKWRPVLQFSWARFKEMFGFGWKILASNLIDTIWQEIYQIVIGKCYSTETLGQYTRAKQFSTISSSNLTSVVQRVSYPALSNLQEDKERLKGAFRRTLKVTMIVSFVLMFGMAAAAKSMIQVLVGDQWLECVPYLQLICFSTVLFPFSGLNLDMLKIQGRSDLYLKLEIIQKLIAVIPVVLGIFINIYWMLISGVFVGIISALLNACYAGALIDYNVREQISDIMNSFMMSFFMAIVVYLMSFIPISPFILFPLQLIAGGVITICLCEKYQLDEYVEIKNMVIPLVENFRGRQ